MSTDSVDGPDGCDVCDEGEATHSFGGGMVCEECYNDVATDDKGESGREKSMKETVARHFTGAGLEADRFVSVKDGEKKCVDHDTRWDDPRDVPGSNYGIYSDEDDQLVVLDVDFHREGGDDLNPVALAALSVLPLTLKIQSPHVPDGDRGGHRILKLAGDETPAELFERTFGKKNPVPSWGEVISKNKYVVGPGSQLDECDKDWCDDCSDPDGGWYDFKKNREIATVEPEELIEVLQADPDLTRVDQNQTLDGIDAQGASSGPEPNSREGAADSYRGDGGSGDTPQRDFSRAEIESMLEAVPGDQHFDDWIRTGYAVFDWDGGSTGKSVFESWSRTNLKWESKGSQRQIDYIWENGESGSAGNATVGTLVHLAKENGWMPTTSAKEIAKSLEDDEEMPFWVVRELAVELDVLPRDAFITRETDDGDEYLGFPGVETYNNALEAITEAGYKHNREPADTEPDRPTYVVKEFDDGEGANDASDRWEYARDLYEGDGDYTNEARQEAANALETENAYMHVLETEVLWRFDDDRGYFVPGGEAHIQQTLESKLGAHYSISEKNEITDRIRARNHTHRDELNAKDATDPLLCVGNGVVNFATGELLEHDAKYKFTRGVEYDYPEDGGNPEPVIEFLDGITKREEDWQTLLDHLAHGLMPGHPYRAFVITYGPGGNGKTQLGELFRGFVGEDNAAAVELQDLTGDDDFATGALPSAFINVGDDVSVSEIRNTSTLKTATGGGTLRANEKHEKRFDFTNEAAMFFSANEPPRIAEDKQSIDDRLYPIEMPYRHVDNPDPDNEYERKKVPGISDDLLANETAMEGLLALVVEHGQRLIETDGKYSMPEGPQGRREIYEAASDPIRRFALEFLEEGESSDVILKDDAYTVYTNLCDRDDERPAREDTFKSEISTQSIVDVEHGQTRQLTPGGSRVTCWKYVRFDTDSKSIMPPRLINRYFPGAEDDEGETDDEGESENETGTQERAAFGAEPIRDAARALTGYVTVTAEVATTRRLGEDEAGVKAVVKDASGAIDVVSWDPESAEQLEAAEGECIALQNAEVSEYDGTHQLTTVDGLTTVQSIQRGVGYTEYVPDAHDDDTDDVGVQGGLGEVATTTDGGTDQYAQVEPEVLEILRNDGKTSIADIAGKLGEDPDEVAGAVGSLSTSGRVIIDGDGPSATVDLS